MCLPSGETIVKRAPSGRSGTAPGVGDKTGVRFATLMRILTQENDGSFVGLNSIRP